MKPTGVPVQDEMFPEGVDGGLMDMDEVPKFYIMITDSILHVWI